MVSNKYGPLRIQLVTVEGGVGVFSRILPAFQFAFDVQQEKLR